VLDNDLLHAVGGIAHSFAPSRNWVGIIKSGLRPNDRIAGWQVAQCIAAMWMKCACGVTSGEPSGRQSAEPAGLRPPS